MTENNGRHATVELVNEKVRALKWEMRAWMLGLVLAVVFHFNVPQNVQTVTHTALAYFK